MSNRLILVIGDLHIPDRAIDLPAKFKKLLTPGKIGQILCLGNLTSASVYTWLRTLAPDLHVVKGQFDIPLTTQNPLSQQQTSANTAPLTANDSAYAAPLALSKVVTHGGLRIGFTNGFHIVPPGDPDSLLIQARQMDVDVFCWGGTSAFEAYEMEGKFFVNPGSATGAGSWLGELSGTADAESEEDVQSDDEGADEDRGLPTDAVPSFCLMDVQGDVLVLYVYQMKRIEGKDMVHVEKVSYRKGGGGDAG